MIDGKNCTRQLFECGVIENVSHLFIEFVRVLIERKDLVLRFNINLMEVGVINSILASPLSLDASAVLYTMYFRYRKMHVQFTIGTYARELNCIFISYIKFSLAETIL